MTNEEMRRRLYQKGLCDLLSNPTFREFVWTLMRDAGIFVPTFQRGSPHDTSYNEGRRSIGLEVLHILKAAQPGVLGLLEAQGDLLALKQAPTPTESQYEFSNNADDDEP